jgi:hypothetical protein
MKTAKIFSYCFLTLAMVCLSACESTWQTIVGEYSFKVSGQVTKDATQVYSLPNEIGAMEVIHLQNSTYLLTFNTINGEAYTTKAIFSNNQLELYPFSRTVTITYQSQNSDIWGEIIEFTETEEYQTDVYGYGNVYGETIEFKMQYSGTELGGNKQIKGNNITMLAKKN